MREEGHTQWKIRETAKVMGDILRDISPLVYAVLDGKDGFEARKKSFFEK